jgi:tubulin-specific chaperone D
LDYIEQVLDTVIGLLSIHSVVAASLYDMPTIAENTWHGSCLACAEIIRRGLIPSKMLPQVIEWMSKVSYDHILGNRLTVSWKALLFDIRKGSHSIGSSVRDAAAYALWALARAVDHSSLAPHAISLSQRLITVALFDREVSIRRAASAAFQEHVGRLVRNASEALSNRCYSSSRTCFYMVLMSRGKQISMPLASGEMPF